MSEGSSTEDEDIPFHDVCVAEDFGVEDLLPEPVDPMVCLQRKKCIFAARRNAFFSRFQSQLIVPTFFCQIS